MTRRPSSLAQTRDVGETSLSVGLSLRPSVNSDVDSTSNSSDLVDHVLLVDEVAGALDEAEELADVRGPGREGLLGAHPGREGHDAGGAVDLREQVPVADERRELLLGLALAEPQQHGESVHADAPVVLGRHPQVVLRRALWRVVMDGLFRGLGRGSVPGIWSADSVG